MTVISTVLTFISSSHAIVDTD